jgi:hypothetical protein
MVDIIFPPTTAPGIMPAESGGRLINAYAENLPGLPKAPYVLRRSAGLTQFSDTTRSGFRGSFFDVAQLYSAWNSRLVWTDSAGVTTDIGALAGAEWVSFAHNNRTPTPDYVVATSAGLFPFTTGGVGAALATPALGNSVTFGEGFFFYSVADGRVYASDINSTTWNSLNRITAQAAPDILLRVIYYNGELYICGTETIEVWGSNGNPNPTGFPLNRTTVVWRGLKTPSAITGWETNFGGRLCWWADDNTIRMFNGYEPVIISTPILHKLLEKITDPTTVTMGCFVITGRQCIYLRAPSFFWVYDVASNRWHERRSYLSPTSRMMGGASSAFGKWISADANSGKLAVINEDTGLEYGDPLIYAIESQPSQQYPARMQVSRVNFTMQQGTGKPFGGDADVNPQLEISWTDDDGNTWVPPILRPIGALGAYRTMVDATALGMTGYVGRRWRLACSADVYLGVLAGTADVFMRK